MDKLDLKFPEKGIKKAKIGELTEKTIKLLGIDRKPCDIVIWDDRLKYIEKHKKDFKDEETYYKCMEKIPLILKEPDYVGLHPNDGSIQYIKQIDELTLVGIRLKASGELCLRSSYKITEGQLKYYIESGRVKKYEVDG